MRAWIGVALLCGGCISTTTTFDEVVLRGEVVGTSGGSVTLSAHLADSGEGDLATHMVPIEQFDIGDGSAFDVVLAYPRDLGEGLVLYAWEDVDGDGVYCSIDGQPEQAGLTEVVDFPAYEVQATITLSELCAGPELLYP